MRPSLADKGGIESSEGICIAETSKLLQAGVLQIPNIAQ